MTEEITYQVGIDPATDCIVMTKDELRFDRIFFCSAGIVAGIALASCVLVISIVFF
jgi:hypothetical protein